MENLKIEIDGFRAKIYLEGEDISDKVTSYKLTHKGGELPVLQLNYNETKSADKLTLTIEANPKEIADLVSQLQNQPKENFKISIDGDTLAKIFIPED